MFHLKITILICYFDFFKIKNTKIDFSDPKNHRISSFRQLDQRVKKICPTFCIHDFKYLTSGDEIKFSNLKNLFF